MRRFRNCHRRWRWRRSRCRSSTGNSEIQRGLGAKIDLLFAGGGGSDGARACTGGRADDRSFASAGDTAENGSGSGAADNQAGVAATVRFAVDLFGLSGDGRIADLRDL